MNDLTEYLESENELMRSVLANLTEEIEELKKSIDLAKRFKEIKWRRELDAEYVYTPYVPLMTTKDDLKDAQDLTTAAYNVVFKK